MVKIKEMDELTDLKNRYHHYYKFLCFVFLFFSWKGLLMSLVGKFSQYKAMFRISPIIVLKTTKVSIYSIETDPHFAINSFSPSV